MTRYKKIAFVSGGRMDFGLMTPVLNAIDNSRKLKLQLYYTGLHLMPKFGHSEGDVKKKFPHAKKIAVSFHGDSRIATAHFASDLFNKLINEFNKTKPDLTITLGDRVEMLMVAIASVYLGIPTAQIHGGDKTYHIDEIARHAITKLSHLHFAATEDSAKRIEKMGEEKWRIHTVGAPGLDTILNEKLPDKKDVFKLLNLKPGDKYILVVLHPVFNQINMAGRQMNIILNAVKKTKLPVVIIYPNTDPGAMKIIREIEKQKNNPLFRIFPNLEYKIFLALEKYTSCWITNSSAGRIESGSFGIPVVNVGIRQLDRPQGSNVIDVGFNHSQLSNSIDKCLNDMKFLNFIKMIKNPWGDGKTSNRIVRILENICIDNKLLDKQITY